MLYPKQEIILYSFAVSKEFFLSFFSEFLIFKKQCIKIGQIVLFKERRYGMGHAMHRMTVTEGLLNRARDIPFDNLLRPPELPEECAGQSLGHMPLFHQRLFTLWQHLSRKSELKAVDVRYCANPEERQKLENALASLRGFADLCSAIFWAELKSYFRSWGRLGLNGWEVIMLEESRTYSIFISPTDLFDDE